MYDLGTRRWPGAELGATVIPAAPGAPLWTPAPALARAPQTPASPPAPPQPATADPAVAPPPISALAQIRSTPVPAWELPEHVNVALLKRVIGGLKALDTRAAAPRPAPSGGIEVPAALLPDIFVPEGTAAGGSVWFGFGRDADAPDAPDAEPSFGCFAAVGAAAP